jgi:hypothetical protein
MSAPTPFALLANGTSLPWTDVPAWPVADFLAATGRELDRGARLCALFGVEEEPGTCLVAVLAFDADNTLAVARSQPFHGAYPSLTVAHPQAHLFEREILEQHGLTPTGHPWLKPVRKSHGDAPANGEFFRVEGREVHEVAVGPVHAGIIEPGHFRFQCAGEEVLHLEIALGYQHRGVEEALPGGPHRATMSQMETVAGDSTIAHATAYATILESLAGTEAPLRAQWLRAVALELERLANHSPHVVGLRQNSRRLPQSDRAALREPIRSRPGPARRRPARPRTAASRAAFHATAVGPGRHRTGPGLVLGCRLRPGTVGKRRNSLRQTGE